MSYESFVNFLYGMWFVFKTALLPFVLFFIPSLLIFRHLLRRKRKRWVVCLAIIVAAISAATFVFVLIAYKPKTSNTYYTTHAIGAILGIYFGIGDALFEDKPSCSKQAIDDIEV